MTFKRFLIGLIVIAGFVFPARGQQANLPPTQLVLEVQFFPKVAPGYQVVSADNRAGAWWARFARVSGWKQPADWPAVTAVNINSELAEDGVRVRVSVYLGEMHEQEKSVASYILHENEKQTVHDLANFGVQPFEIKLVRVSLTAIELPQFTSKATSIELVVMQPNLSTLPSFDVVVRNVSNKNVNALHEKVLQSGRAQIMSMRQGKEGQPLILPGGTYSFTTPVATRARPSADGFTPFVLPNQIIEVSTAVFDDGTFEGDSDAALEFAAFQKGRSLQLRRVVGVLDSAAASNDSPDANVVSLKNSIEVLSIEASSAAVQELQAKFPGTDERRVKSMIEIGMKGLRDATLNDIIQFRLRNRRVEATTFREWLALYKQRYEAWLNRL